MYNMYSMKYKEDIYVYIGHDIMYNMRLQSLTLQDMKFVLWAETLEAQKKPFHVFDILGKISILVIFYFYLKSSFYSC